METIGLGSEPPKNEADFDISEKNNYCKVCWQNKGEYKCIGGMICPSCLNKLPYEMRGDIADVLIYDAIRAAKKYGNQPQPVQAQGNKTIKAAPVTTGTTVTQSDAAPTISPAGNNSTNSVPGASLTPNMATTASTLGNPGAAPEPALKEQPKRHVVIYGAVLGVLVIAAIALILFMKMGGSASTSLNSEDIVAQLQDFGFPIVYTSTYDESSDPEGLLGVDGEYISKTSFTDSRGTQSLSCSIEVFDNAADAETRSLYLESSSASVFYSPTVYTLDNVIMVLDPGLSSSAVMEYENALTAIINGEEYTGSANEDPLDDDYSNDYGNDYGNDDNSNSGIYGDTDTDSDTNTDSDSGGGLNSIAPSPLQ